MGSRRSEYTRKVGNCGVHMPPRIYSYLQQRVYRADFGPTLDAVVGISMNDHNAEMSVQWPRGLAAAVWRPSRANLWIPRRMGI